MSALKRASATLTALVALFLMSTTSADERSFMLTPDPGFVLVDLRYHGGQTGMNSAYTLYADGRLVAKRIHHLRGVVEEVEHQVEAGELDAFLQTLVDAGLYESNQELLEERMGPKRRVIAVSDSPTMHLTVALQRYQGIGEAEPSEVRVSLESLHPFFIARYFDNVDEIQCLDHIARWFAQYRPNPSRLRLPIPAESISHFHVSLTTLTPGEPLVIILNENVDWDGDQIHFSGFETGDTTEWAEIVE